MKTILITAAIAASLSIATAFAHGGATGIVKERMDMMGNLKSAIKTLVPIMKGDQDYDAKIVITQAKIIQENSGKHMIMGFPEDSIKGPSEASPEIWRNWHDFQKLAKDLNLLAVGLEKSANNAMHSPAKIKNTSMMEPSMMQMGQGKTLTNMDIEQVSFGTMPPNNVFKMVTQNCSACHTKYRIEN